MALGAALITVLLWASAFVGIGVVLKEGFPRSLLFGRAIAFAGTIVIAGGRTRRS